MPDVLDPKIADRLPSGVICHLEFALGGKVGSRESQGALKRAILDVVQEV
jgi:hypothetical protein